MTIPFPLKLLHYYREQLFTAVHNFIHLNLSIALLAGYIVFAVGVELAARNTVYDIALPPEMNII